MLRSSICSNPLSILSADLLDYLDGLIPRSTARETSIGRNVVGHFSRDSTLGFPHSSDSVESLAPLNPV